MDTLPNFQNVTFEATWAAIQDSNRFLTEKQTETDRLLRETQKEIRELNKQYGGISKSNGDMAEEFFFNTFKRDKTFANQTFDRIRRGYFYCCGDYSAEFDVVLFNGICAAIIEVKYNAKPENIDIEFLISRVEKLKQYSPTYKDKQIYLGVAALTFQKGIDEELRRAGIATVHQVGKKMVIYDKEVKAF
jgi:hypothetical protein